MADRLRQILRSDQGRLFALASSFIFMISIGLTLAPAVQARSWDTDLPWTHWVSSAGWIISFGAILYFLDLYQIKSGKMIIPVTALLTGWGLLTIFRISTRMGLKQTIWLAVATVVLILGLPYLQKALSLLRRYKYIWLIGGIILTALTLIFGTNPNGVGPRLWFGCCGIYFQPSEPLKILLVLYLAAYFADRQPFSPRLLPLLFPTLLMTGLACLILIVQRDLGTASVLIAIYAALIYAATGKKRLLVISMLGIGLAALLGNYFFDVVQLRFEAWINPWADPFGRSYQIVQSLISIAAGGMTGRGPGMGYPNLVPISFSDFIFSAIGEEFGFPGTIGLIISILLFSYRGLKIGLKAPNRHMRYVAVGISVYIATQSILIIGGNIRLLPLTGVTLPFLSYGGSSLLTSMFALYLLIAINNAPPGDQPPPESSPVINLAALLTAGFIAIALINSWWALWRGPDLLTRADNARRSISDTSIQRGSILDRNGTILSYSTGKSGDYSRQYTLTEFAHPIGYTHSFYGQAGSESSLDDILRGLENQSPWTIWINHLIYGQPPPGLDAKISLNSQKQALAVSLLEDHVGAAVLMDVDTGEVLVLASSPTYNPSQLAETWDQLINHPDSPLLNRAVQGLYPPGPSLAPFLITVTSSYGPLSEEIILDPVNVEGQQIECTSPPEEPFTWEAAAQLGCPRPLSQLGAAIGEESLFDLFTDLGFYQSPDIRLETSPPFVPSGIPTPGVTAYGQADILVTPLQLAIATAALSNHGLITLPVFLTSAENPDGGWISTMPEQQPERIFSQSAADKTTSLMAHDSLPLWETSAYAITGSGAPITWYLAGSLPSSTTIDQDFAVVILLEERDANLAAQIGRNILINALVP